MSTDASATAAPTREGNRSRLRVLLASYIGSVIEWYDFYLYGAAAAVVFQPLFFPNLSPVLGLMASFATLGGGFIARPIGGLIWGHFGDRLGRKRMLVMSVLLMGTATALVGVLPTFSQIGIWAPILLVILRLVQGLSAGGEWAGAGLMALEHARPHRRGLWSSVAQIGVGSGIALSLFVFSLFARLPEETFLSWGWRIPFLGAAILVVVGLYIRLKVEESPVFQEAQQRRGSERASSPSIPLVDLLKNEWRKLLVGILLVIGPFTASAVFITFGLSYTTQVGYDSATATTALTIATVVSVLGGLTAAAISDYVGRKPVYAVGAVLLGVMSFVVFSMFNTQSVLLLYVGWGITYGTHSIMYGPMAAYLAELFTTTTRYTGSSIGYQLAASLGGGFGPLIATSLLALGGGPPNTLYVSLFMAATCVASLVGVLVSRETYRSSLTEVSQRS